MRVTSLECPTIKCLTWTKYSVLSRFIFIKSMFYTHSTLPYCYSVVEMEAQSEHDADEALWSMLEFEQLLIFISSSLVMNFPLYII